MNSYKRILLKLSGEALGNSSSAYDKEILFDILNQIKLLRQKYNIELAIVIGGGNIFRGQLSDELGLGENTESADYMGMQATIINAFAFKTLLKENGVEAEIQNALDYEFISQTLNPEKAKEDLENDKVILFAGGTGKPYVSTDTAAVKRALEINADVILLAKKNVDGVYSSDPLKNISATMFDKLTFQELLDKDLKVMDKEAVEILNDSNIDVIVFNMNVKNNIVNVIENPETPKTIISKEK